MAAKAKQILTYLALIAIVLYFTVVGLIAAKPFLAPLSIAILLTMILIPVVEKLEHWHFNRGWAALVATIAAMALFGALFYVLSVQISSVAKDWPEIKERVEPQIEKLQQFIDNTTGIEPDQQKDLIEKNMPATGENNSEEAESGDSGKATPASDTEDAGQSLFSMAGTALIGFVSFLGTSLLTFVYIFFMLLYRSKIRKSILRFFPPDRQEQAEKILWDSIEVSKNYLGARLLLIVFLTIFYSIGFYISDIREAFLISVLAAVLSLLPYIGNFIALGLALMMAAFSGAETSQFVGVILTMGITQFVDTYTLEPYVIGGQVNLNPLATIIIVVMAGAVWGAVGMVIAIPLFGIFKIIFDRVRVLKPLGYALGNDEMQDKDGGFLHKAGEKLRRLFHKK